MIIGAPFWKVATPPVCHPLTIARTTALLEFTR